VDSMIMMVAIVVAYRIKIDFKQTKKLKITLQNIIAREAVLPAVIVLILAVGFNTINSFLIVFADKQGVNKNIGLFFTVYASTLLFTRPLIGRLTDKHGLVKVAIPALSCTAISFLIISFSTALPMFLLAAFVNAFGFGACQPALQSIAMKTVPRNRRGSAISTNYIGMDMGTIIGPILAGIFAEQFGYVAMWRFQIIPFMVAISILLITRQRMTKIEKDFLAMTDHPA
jgi:MFS family permease